MIRFDKFVLDNGLRVIVHEDRETPLVAVNVLYDVGSKDEDTNKTGFAHLFEHLMFGGSLNVPDFDGPIQNAGGENNAFTNSDVTNFYNVVPASNIETAFWLESDRMLQLNFSEKTLEAQKKVVLEEFKETTLNKPYGNLWHNLSALAYNEHPYRWPTIGLEPSHIANAQLSDVKDFFYKHYRPNNAILSVSGNIGTHEVKKLAQKWFGPIPIGEISDRRYSFEKEQNEKRTAVLQADVPADALYMAFPIPERIHPDFPVYDLITDILSEGDSAVFYKHIVKPAKSFSQLYAYLSGTIDPGLFIIDGKLLPGKDMEEGIKLIWKELNMLCTSEIDDYELQKAKNKFISSSVFSDVSILNKAMNLAYYELLGDVNLINKQIEAYESVTVKDIKRVAQGLFVESKLNEVRYLMEKE